MSYERDLAFNLRIRGLPEDEIAETLDEVRAHAAANGSPAEDEFGSPQEYAKQFPSRKRAHAATPSRWSERCWRSPMRQSRCFFCRSCAIRCP